MIIDAQNRPSNGQTISEVVGTYVSTDSIDMLSNLRQISRGFPPRMQVTMATALVGAGASIQAQLIESAAGNLGSPTVLASGPVVGVADAIAGKELLDVAIPDTTKRYLGVQYLISGATTTDGTVNAHLVAGTDRPTTDIPFNTGL